MLDHLRQDGQAGAQVMQADVGDVDAINKDGSASRLDDSKQAEG